MQTHPFFFYNKRAWEELYVIIFRFFDQKWNQMGVGYMGFQKVIEVTEEQINAHLKKRNVMGIPAIFDMFGILLEDLDSFKSENICKKSKSMPIPSPRTLQLVPKEELLHENSQQEPPGPIHSQSSLNVPAAYANFRKRSAMSETSNQRRSISLSRDSISEYQSNSVASSPSNYAVRSLRSRNKKRKAFSINAHSEDDELPPKGIPTKENSC